MKKFLALLGIVALAFTSCEGPEGPEGDYIVGTTYEVSNVNFSPSQSFYRFILPENIYDSDAILVYRLEAVTEGLDVWEPLPTATIFYDDGGYLQYRFNYTYGDVDLIMESDDISLATSEYTNNQVFRIIVVPSDFGATFTGDISNIQEVLAALHVSKNDIYKLD